MALPQIHSMVGMNGREKKRQQSEKRNERIITMEQMNEWAVWKHEFGRTEKKCGSLLALCLQSAHLIVGYVLVLISCFLDYFTLYLSLGVWLWLWLYVGQLPVCVRAF